MNINKPQLSFEVVYSDEDLFQVEVIASNGRFAGTALFYFGLDGKELIEFGEKLRGFPKAVDQVIYQEFGHTRKEISDLKEIFLGLEPGIPYIGLKFFCADRTGHSVVDIVLFDMGKVSLELQFDPASLDQFVQELINVGNTEEGKATLVGIISNPNTYG